MPDGHSRVDGARILADFNAIGDVSANKSCADRMSAPASSLRRPAADTARVQFGLPTLVVRRFSLISRCTHRARAAP
jgi:hypothetical protein